VGVSDGTRIYYNADVEFSEEAVEYYKTNILR
jgi:hypothetical protein